MSTKNVGEIVPAQCRGARGLLNMTQPGLAVEARLGLSTIVDFEKGRRTVSAEAIQKIRTAIEKAGVEFIDENGGGPGIRLRKKSTKKNKIE